MSVRGHNEAKFKAAILGLSISKDWDEAKAEWELFFVYDDPNDRACQCEHSPIHQICVIRNRKNTKRTEVGNVCVRRFLRLFSNRIFLCIKRLRNDIHKSLNPKSLELFRERGVISAGEEQEYKSYWRKRVHISDDEKRQKLDINSRVLTYIDVETAKLIASARAHGIKIAQ